MVVYIMLCVVGIYLQMLSFEMSYDIVRVDVRAYRYLRIIIIIIYLFYIALNPCTVLSASQLKGVTLHH